MYRLIDKPKFQNLRNTDLYPNQGLRELKGFWESLSYAFKILYLKFRYRNQPSFFISNESWELLRNGQTKSRSSSSPITWLPEGYQVYAFVFCVAFYEPVNHDKEEEKLDKLGYFRIRTIIKKIDEPAKDKQGEVVEAFVETENIAYADLHEAMKGDEIDCVKFISEKDLKKPEVRVELDRVNTDVLALKKSKNGNSITSKVVYNKIPDFFKNPQNPNESINNEGHVFGKDRISKIIETTTGNGTTISFIWNESKREINFHFKRNPEYITELPCPTPLVCGSGEQ